MKEKCPLCPKGYQSENDLDEHLKKIHNTDLETVQKIQRKSMIGDSLAELWDNPEDERWNRESE